MKTAIVGGGAAGFFLAVNLKEMAPGMEVAIFERSHKPLAKVEVSGGGRCNCTNSFEGVADLQAVYPRGHRLLKRLFQTFDHRAAFDWFEQRGVRLVTQADHCVFPASQDAHTITHLFLSTARRLGVELHLGEPVDSLERLAGYDFVAVTTGGSPRAAGLEWLARAGHEVVAPVPSLFSLSVADERLRQLMGTVVEGVQVALAGTKLRASGPLLITHWGLSGPAVLRLSSYAARQLHEAGYQAPLAVNWTGLRDDEVAASLSAIVETDAQKLVASVRPFGLPARLWSYLVEKTLGERAHGRWQSLNRKELNRLVNALVNDVYTTAGRAPFRDEFVTCGGVSLSAVNPNTLESRHVAGLYFAGEVLDVDGVTGGFNFQAAWTTAYTVARAIASR